MPRGELPAKKIAPEGKFPGYAGGASLDKSAQLIDNKLVTGGANCALTIAEYEMGSLQKMFISLLAFGSMTMASAARGEIGIASWYGPGFHGQRAASGEIFSQLQFTAAHRTLPFGTTVRVTNLENGKSVIVRINDRGPYVRGRILDLSRAAARQLGMTKRGKVRVSLSILPQDCE